MTKSATFGNRLGVSSVNSGGSLDITGISVTEDAVGSVNSFLDSPGLTLLSGGIPNFLSPYAGLRWTSFGAGALAPGSSLTVNFSYNVTATDPLRGINELQQSFTVDTQVGSGLTMQAVETVYDSNNNVVGRITVNLGNTAVPNAGGVLPGANDFQLVAAYSSLRVEVTLTASVAADAPVGSAVNISVLNNGFRQTTLATQARIGDYVWEDTNNNGVQDSGEAGVAGVTVKLTNASGSLTYMTTTTDANGKYEFANLNAGSYVVEFVKPGSYAFATADQGSDAADSDANAATGRSGLITLAAGEVNTTIDAGLVKLLTLGDRVWLDADADGIQDSGEAGLAGVSVTLTNIGADLIAGTTDDVVVGTQVTDGAGKYLFTGLQAGQYVASFDAPSGYLFSEAGQGGNAATDSNANSTGGTDVITLAADDLTIDAGVYQTASLGDFVWNDANNNGVQDSGEAGIEGVTVKLLDAKGNETGQTAVTDVNGQYLFDGLTPGSYGVTFVAPAGYSFSTANQGDDSKDSDANAAGTTGSVTLTSGQTNTTLDAGLVQLRAIGDFAWIDADADGVQDSGEAGLAGVSVTLTNLGANGVLGGGDDSVVGTQTTGANGAYLFTGLLPGSYALQFTAPGGYVASAAGQGGNPALDSNINSAGATGVVTLTTADDLSIDAGFHKLASLGDFVFGDLNKNGIQDSGELGIEGIEVTLLDGKGASTGLSTFTDANGLYRFDNLVPGTYAVSVDPGLTYVVSPKDAGGDDTKDSDANAAGITGTVTLASGDDNRTLDVGLYKPGSGNTAVLKLGDFVWLDADADGVQDLGEGGVSGVGVELINLGTDGTFGTLDDKSVGTTVTDGMGKYLFTDLAPGSYVARFTAPSGYLYSPSLAGGNTGLDSNPLSISGATGTTGTIVLTNTDDLTIDAGLYKTAALGNFVWNDANNNGIQDSGEAGIAGVTVKLLNGAGVDTGISTKTDANGLYSFTGLTPGSYGVQFVAPSGFAFSKADQGGDSADSDANVTTGKTGSVTLTSGQTDDTLDAGLVKLLSLGNYAWIDADADGVQDGDELGLAGVSVTLTNLGANGVLGGGDDSVVGTQTTGTGGAYLFSGLLPGSYALQFTAPSGYVTTAAGQGGDTALDSNINSTGATGVVTLTSDDLTIDAGFYQKASLGDFVWKDTNGNGIQDTGEAGFSGVTVRLLDGDGKFTGISTVTNASGAYQFTNLIPGEYGIQVVAPSGWVFTSTDSGADDARDSDVNAAGTSGTVVLRSGDFNRTLDAGLSVYCPPPPVTYKLGDRVWVDSNGNGTQDSGESGLACVSVKLINVGTDGVLGGGNDVVVGTTTTDSYGKYLFSNLTAGNYVVQFTAPSGYSFTTALAGTDRAVDSNPTSISGSIGTTQTIVLNADNLTIDAGLYKPASIGNFVWLDCDKDGIQDCGEDGIAGVTVRLFSGTGVDLNRSTVTDASGFYSFGGLAPGSYQVQFVAPTGYAFTAQDRGTNDAVDSDANASGRTGTYTLVSGQNNTTVDAGLVKVAATFVEARPGLTPGFWGQRLEVWDGNTTNDGKASNLVASGVLRRTDVLAGVANDCWGKGILLGDSNANGYTDSGETTLFVPLAAAQQIIRSSDSTNDTRQILMKHTIAAQLNIYNGAGSPGDNPNDGIVGAEMITLAVKWLRGMQLDSNSGMQFVYPDGTSGSVDRRGTAGVLNTGTTNASNVDFNTATGTFNSTRLASSGNAWNLGVDADPTAGILKIDGEGLKNILDEYNNNKLVMSADGAMVAWKNGTSYLGAVADTGVNYLRVGASYGLPLT